MTAPTSRHANARRLIVERTYQPDAARCVAAIVKLLTYRSTTTDTAGRCRPLGTGDQSEQHETGACPCHETGAGFAEDSHNGSATITAAEPF